MNITAYSNFSKELNSTKQPSGGTNISVRLKDATSLLYPVFRVHHFDTSHNYIKWGDRYYYITDKVFNSDQECEYHCKVDAMASFKSAIGSSIQYILRSASEYNAGVIDTFYPILSAQFERSTTSPQDPNWSTDIDDGQFVIGVVGNNASPNGGAVTYYAISPAGMRTITNYLLDPANYSSITDISADLLKCIFNPMDFIVSCMWFPFKVTYLGSEDIAVGWWWITGVEASKISDPVYTRNISFSVPQHPQANERGRYLNMKPFARYYCNAGPWGVVPVDNSLIIGEDKVGFIMKIDLYTGSGRLSLIASDVLAYTEDYIAQVGVPIQLGQNMLNQGAVSGIAGGISQIATGLVSGGHGAILGGTVNSIASALDLTQAVSRTIGSNGTMAINTIFRFVGEFMPVAEESVQKNGRPLCAPRRINSLSGYIQVLKADVNITGTPEEKTEIQQYMEGGFFYE